MDKKLLNPFLLKSKYGLVFFLDINGTFNSARKRAIVISLEVTRIEPAILSWIKAQLSWWKIKLGWNEATLLKSARIGTHPSWYAKYMA